MLICDHLEFLKARETLIFTARSAKKRSLLIHRLEHFTMPAASHFNAGHWAEVP